MGNISTYTAGGETVTYTYDAQGQLLKAVGDETYTYTYDAAGNILTANGHTYTYGNTNWRDLLTAFDGETISYDAIGNPTSYYNGTRWTFSWSNGRQLTSASNGTNNITYTYTADGMRTSKVVDGVTYNYYYASGKLLRQTWGDNVLDFFYDTSGTPYALKHNGTLYYYITNLQGDVLHLIDGSGNITATYEYDPYGNIISSSGWAAGVNPLRYRGYYYDTETGLYYLQSRYYDPTTGRFINSDSYASTGQGIVGHNMFAYCNNDPINCYDPSGNACIMTFSGDVNLFCRDLSGFFGIGGGGGGGGSAYAFAGASSCARSLKKMKEIVGNTSEEAVLEAEHFAFYKGTLFVKTDLGNGGAFSFIVVFIDDNYTTKNGGTDVVKHEHGHRVHLDQIGTVNYLFKVAIPSLICAGLTNEGVIDNKYYHSIPTEYIADWLGGAAHNSITAWEDPVGRAYWLWTVLTS